MSRISPHRLSFKWVATFIFFVNSIVIFQYINHMKTDNPDEIMLNHEYLKKIQDSEEKQSDEIPQDMKDYVDELMENPLNHVDCSVMKYILDYLSDPMNSSIYRDQTIFKNQSNIDEQNDESESEDESDSEEDELLFYNISCN